ncbi:PXMP2/4 family protein 4 [Nymphaea thermarum]|nr:PXMP2/4 family protein 4 [Nymphaea thermarum]
MVAAASSSVYGRKASSVFFTRMWCCSRGFVQLRHLHQKPGESVAAANASFSSSFVWVRWYLAMIERHPVLTKAVTASFIFTAADVTSQARNTSPSSWFSSLFFFLTSSILFLVVLTCASFDSYDQTRTLRMAAYGLVISGPSLHLWFNFLSGILPKRDMLSTFKKMVLGQVTYGPFITSVFFSVNAAVQGESGAEIVQRLKRDLVPTLLNGLVYWPMCDFITFKFIPVRLQPLISNSFAFIWTIYLTYMGNLKKASGSKTLAN